MTNFLLHPCWYSVYRVSRYAEDYTLGFILIPQLASYPYTLYCQTFRLPDGNGIGNLAMRKHLDAFFAVYIPLRSLLVCLHSSNLTRFFGLYVFTFRPKPSIIRMLPTHMTLKFVDCWDQAGTGSLLSHYAGRSQTMLQSEHLPPQVFQSIPWRSLKLPLLSLVYQA